MSITSRFFTVTVKPQIPAVKQHAGDITDAQVLFDWTGFDIPKGAAKLIGMTVLYRGKDEVDITPTDFELFFAKSSSASPKSSPSSLGAVAAIVQPPAAGTQPWFNDLIGKVYVDASLMTNDGDMVFMNVLNQTEGDVGITNDKALHAFPGNLVMEGQPESGTNVGYDKVYVAAIAKATHNWESTMTTKGVASTSNAYINLTTKDALKCLAPGDLLANEDGVALGEVTEVVSDTLVNRKGTYAISAGGKVVYNENPIVLKLHFQR